jgi:Autophagy-related protein 27
MMTLHGPTYPSSATLEPIPQEFVLNLLCATEISEPEFKSYNGSQAVVEWKAPSGCNFKEPEGDGKIPEREDENMSNGIGWFFLLFVALCLVSERDQFLTVDYLPPGFSFRLRAILRLVHITTTRHMGRQVWISFRVFASLLFIRMLNR